MNKNWEEKLNLVNLKLSLNSDSVLIARPRKPNKNIENIFHIPQLDSYFDFLRVCNGGSFGSVYFSTFEDLLDDQMYVDDFNVNVDEWLYIGYSISDPIVINKRNGLVYTYPDNTDALEVTVEDFTQLGDFKMFLSDFIFGKRYSELVSEGQEDLWYEFLIKIGLIRD